MVCEIATCIPLGTGQPAKFSTESSMCRGLNRHDQWSAVRLYSVVAQRPHGTNPEPSSGTRRADTMVDVDVLQLQGCCVVT
jgi:hypothetical protein